MRLENKARRALARQLQVELTTVTATSPLFLDSITNMEQVSPTAAGRGPQKSGAAGGGAEAAGSVTKRCVLSGLRLHDAC